VFNVIVDHAKVIVCIGNILTEDKVKDKENIFNKIVAENFPNLVKDIDYMQKAIRTPNRHEQKSSLVQSFYLFIYSFYTYFELIFFNCCAE
jgi:hypothetical protein